MKEILDEVLNKWFGEFLEEYLKNVKKILPQSYRARQMQGTVLEKALVLKFEKQFLKEPFKRAIQKAIQHADQQWLDLITRNLEHGIGIMGDGITYDLIKRKSPEKSIKERDELREGIRKALTSEEVIRIIEKVPPAEKDMPALIVDDKTFTWNEILTEMKKDSMLSKRMLPKIVQMRKSCQEFLRGGLKSK